MVIEHMSKGLSFETFAAVIGVHKDTLYEWRKNFPEFSDSVDMGFNKCQLFWENIGIAGTVGATKGKFNDRSWKFNMQNRFKWKDRTDVTTDDEKLPETMVIYKPEKLPEGAE